MHVYTGKNHPKTLLTTSGSFPSWLNGGSIFRNGPGLFNPGNHEMKHWFDGYSIIQKFSFEEGSVTYQSKFVESQDYLKSTASGKVEYLNFATNPKQNFIQSALQLMSGSISDNPNVNVLKFQDNLLALGEITGNYEIDYATLDTKRKFNFESENENDPVGGDIAHPTYDIATQEYINVGIKLGRPTTYYVYSVKKGSQTKRILWKQEPKDIRYFHSFAVTPSYIIIIEPPLITSLTRLVTKPFIDSYQWQPEKQTRITLINRTTGKHTITHTHPFFFFHIGNAFELDGVIHIDISTYPNAQSIQSGFVIKNIESNNYSFKNCSLQRLTIDINSLEVSMNILHDGVFEFPSIHYKQDLHNPNYSTIYGVTNKDDDFFGILTELNIITGSKKTWTQNGCYAGEPLVVHNKDNADEFVILSLVYDTINENAFILALDHNFDEIARATTTMSVPMSFHGSFVFR